MFGDIRKKKILRFQYHICEFIQRDIEKQKALSRCHFFLLYKLAFAKYIYNYHHCYQLTRTVKKAHLVLNRIFHYESNVIWRNSLM